MFYDQFINLCNQTNEKPTPLMKKLGLSPGNIKRWQDGATVNSDILLILSEHFKVSTDYLLTGKEKSSAAELSANEHEMLKLFNKLPVKDQDRIIGRLEIMVESVEAEERIG